MALLRPLPPPLVLLGLFMVGWVTHIAFSDGATWTRIPQLAVFFAAGVYAKEALKVVARSAGVCVGAGALALVFDQILRMHPPVIWYPLFVLTCFFAAIAVVGIARLASDHVKFVRRFGAWIGRRTLAIYVLHFPFIMLLVVLEAEVLSGAFELLHTPVGGWSYPACITAAIVLLCLIVETVMRRTQASVLFMLPAPLRRAVDPAAARARD